MRQIQSEQIGAHQYAKWKCDPEPSSLPKASWRSLFFLVPFAAILIVAFWVPLRLHRIQHPWAQAASLALVFGFFVLVYGGMFGFIISANRKKRLQGDIHNGPRPEGVPKSALPALVHLMRLNSGYYGKSLGWIWLEDTNLTFAGEGFDFRTPFAVVEEPKRAQRVTKGFRAFQLPHQRPLPQITVRISRVGPPRQWDQEMTLLLKRWRSAARKSSEEIVLPPIRRGVQSPTGKEMALIGIQYSIFAGLVAVATTVLIRNEISDDVSIVSPWFTGAATTAPVTFMFLSMWLQVASNNRVLDQAFQKLQKT